MANKLLTRKIFERPFPEVRSGDVIDYNEPGNEATLVRNGELIDRTNLILVVIDPETGEPFYPHVLADPQ